MAHLIKCIECGGSLSSEAGMCPHCGTHCPKGATCVVCTKLGSKSDFPHKACQDATNQCQYSCPVCKNFITTQVDHCTQCGHPFKTVQCRYCSKYLIKDTAVKIPPKQWKNEYNKGGYCTDSDFAHKACYSSRYSSSCFIATAALGSPLAPEVKTLQTFRDNVLKKYHFGRKFIVLYESVSPPFAHIIARNDILRYLARLLIVYPATWLAKWALKS